MNESSVRRLEVSSDPEDPKILEEVDAVAAEITDSLAFTQDDKDNIAISVSEAVNNAIVHGNGGDPSKKVTILFTPLENALKIEVYDQGIGFDPDSVPDPTDADNLLSESGRGLLIIRHLMDEVDIMDYKTGTLVTMIKQYSSKN